MSDRQFCDQQDRQDSKTLCVVIQIEFKNLFDTTEDIFLRNLSILSKVSGSIFHFYCSHIFIFFPNLICHFDFFVCMQGGMKSRAQTPAQ